MGAEDYPILEGYKQFLKLSAKRLTAVNNAIDKEYKKRLGASATRERQAYLTQVYNYFALPPAHDYFCSAARDISKEVLLAPPSDTDAFALASLVRLEGAFDRFYRDMERYRIDVAQWDAQYAGMYAANRTTAFTNTMTGLPLENGSPLTNTSTAVSSPTVSSYVAPAAVQQQPVAPAMPQPAPNPAISQPVIQPVMPSATGSESR